jgi:hypothetical protein
VECQDVVKMVVGGALGLWCLGISIDLGGDPRRSSAFMVSEDAGCWKETFISLMR